MLKVTHLCFKYIESHASPLHLTFTMRNTIVYKYYNHYQILGLFFFFFLRVMLVSRESLKSLQEDYTSNYICL